MENINQENTSKISEITKDSSEQDLSELTNDDLIKLFQKNIKNIRNICILAHVDHGKTSLCDSLISYINIISPRMAGDIRYMDSRQDEQARNITMKSSSISIPYHSNLIKDNYLINIIDSPGHVDFSYEIFSALKMVDGALILIDVVEGICSQTESVIRQAWDEKIKCVLVFNKIDKLITTINLDPMEAYERLNNLLQKVNALMSSLILRDIELEHLSHINSSNAERKYSDSNKTMDNIIERKYSDSNKNLDNIIEQKENDFYFSPEKGNVIFASAYDNWAFTLDSFSYILSEKFGFKRETLKKVLWGDFYYNAKTKKISKEPFSSKSRPIFVDFILENIYKMYRVITMDKDFEKTKKIISSFKFNISEKEFNQKNIEKNPQIILRSIMRQWLPIPSTVFDVVVEFLPNPISGIQTKIDLLFPNSKYSHNEFITNLKSKIKLGQIVNDNLDENNSEVPTIAYISKMIPLSVRTIEGIELTNENKDDIKFMAFARVFTGKIKKGSELFIIGPKHDIKENKYDIIKFKLNNVYYFMGNYLNKIDLVSTGNIFSIGGLENHVFKTATISSNFECPSIVPLNLNKNSNIKISISPENIKDMNILIEGLKKLNRCDPAVVYYVQSNGEHILETSGEVHLERSLKDLEDFLTSKVKFNLSKPIVNFKEGLKNTNYNYRKKDDEKLRKKEEIEKAELELKNVKAQERKTDLDEYYVVVEGEENIDIDNQEDILKSCTPMILTNKKDTEKKPPKIAKHKIKDVLNKNEKKLNQFIEKKQNSSIQKGFAECSTPNKVCSFGITAFGMEEDLINLIEENQKIIEEVEENEFIVDSDLFEKIMQFKDKMLATIQSKKVLNIVENNLYSFGIKEGRINMLLIKGISKENLYFNRIKLDDSNKDNSDFNTNINVETKNEINTEKLDNESFENKVQTNLHGNTTSKEVVNAIKNGFDMAIKNGPLCEENMYGVIFVIEYVNFTKKDNSSKEEKVSSKDEDKKEESNNLNKEEDKKENNNLNKKEENVNLNKEEDKKEDSNLNKEENINLNKEEEILPEDKKDKIEDKLEDLVDKECNSASANDKSKNVKSTTKSDTASQQTSVYGPFLGQIMSTVKECCRKAFLSGDPRLYEALYLCIFQISQENVGKIHFVISKRRGDIINEIPSDENIKSTIEAVVPVAESFGFVEEIRKKSSGLTNPMLQFYKWQLLDIDPFDVATEEDIENFGENVDLHNIAKKYINQIRVRKGLVTDEKIVKAADKQSNLAKKR